jgi:ATP-dependent helicase/nuclease subunit B
MQPECHFLDEERPLAQQAAEWLLARAESGGGCADLGDWGVVVPTAESGRVLVSMLTHLAPRQAVLLPRVFTPVQVLRGPEAEGVVASEPERLMAWCEVLGGLDFQDPADRCEAVFPAVPPVQDFTWAHGVARLLLQTQNSLMEGGHDMAGVIRSVPQLREADRWEVLQELERRHRMTLAAWGVEAPLERWLRLLDQPAWDESVSHWALIGVPDPIPMVRRVLEKSARPVHCVVHASPARRKGFDDWGRPLPGFWARWVQPLEHSDSLHLHVNESGQSRAVSSLVQGHRGAPAVVVGICREELLPRVRETLEADGIGVHDPSGEPAVGHEVVVLLSALQELVELRSLRALRALVVHPAGLRGLMAGKDGAVDSPTPWLERLDRHEVRHLSRTLEDVLGLPDYQAHSGLGLLVEAAETTCQRLEGKSGLEGLRDWLGAAYAEREMDGEGGELLEMLDEWIERALPLVGRFRQLRISHLLKIWAEALGGQRLSGIRNPRAVALKGWLELAWDEHPHLVLCGVQEGAVPLSLTGDVFLPESLRAALGLRTSDDILARDAFLLHGLLASRRKAGRVDLLLSKFTDAGEPLRPSRLLLQTTDAELPGRVAQLFGDPAEGVSTPAPTGLFTLDLPARDPQKRHISVTHFSDFLQSPLYFHLNRSLKWESYPSEKREMDPMDFGDLAHQSLEAWGKDPVLCPSVDAVALRNFFDRDVRERATLRFGKQWPLAVEIQIEALIQRLGRFAELQAEEAAQGWRVHAVEYPFKLPIGEWTVRGKIDRIDVHSDGRVRLLDYKTSETAKSPAEAHVKEFKRTPLREKYPAQAWMERGKAGAVWLNLQLPLYMAYWRQAHPVESLECGYVQLPNSLEAVEFSLWKGFDPGLESGAVACADAILKALEKNDRTVIPMADCWKREPWSEWFPGGPGDSLTNVQKI